MTATLLNGILSNKVGEKSKWERFYKEIPRFVDELRTFREVGVVWDYKNKKNGQQRWNSLFCMILDEPFGRCIQDV